MSVKLAVEARDLFWQEYQQQCSRPDGPPRRTPAPPLPPPFSAYPLDEACTDEVAGLVGSGHKGHRAEDGAQQPSKGQDTGQTESSAFLESREETTAAPTPAITTAPATSPVAPAIPAAAAAAAAKTSAAAVAAAVAPVAAEYHRSRLPEEGERKQTTTEATTSTMGAASTATSVATPTAVATKAQQRQQQRQQRRRYGWGKRLRPLVAASVGCYGAALADGSEYQGDYGSSIGWLGLKAWHQERLEVLAGAEGVDFVLFETVPCLAEVRAILFLLQARGRGTAGEGCCSTVMSVDVFVASGCLFFIFLCLAFLLVVSSIFIFLLKRFVSCAPCLRFLIMRTCQAYRMWLGTNNLSMWM